MKNLIIISLLFLFSCVKDGKNIYVEGRVVNPVTGEGIPNITLDLRKQVPDPGGSGSDSKTVKTVLSDQNGYFTIAHNGSLFNSYIIHMSNSNGIGYHVAGWKDASGTSIGGYNLEVDKGQYMNVRYELVPYGKMRIWHRNLNCFNTNDSIHIFRVDEFHYTDGDYKRYGCIIDEQQGYYTVPMGDVFLSWTVYRENNSPQTFSDVFNFSTNDSMTYIIEY